MAGLIAAGVTAAAALAAVAISAKVVARTFTLVNEEAKRAAEFNARVAAVAQLGEARRMIGTIHRAERIAPQLEAYTLERDALAEELRELRTTFVGAVAPALTDAIAMLGDILSIVNTVAQSPAFAAMVEAGADGALGMTPGVLRLFREALRKYVQQDGEDEDADFLRDINEFLDPTRVGT